MTLHLTHAEWERIAAAGSGVLFRASDIVKHPTPDYPYHEFGPPAEFVAAAQPCETCGDEPGWILTPHPSGRGYFADECPDCLDGKRRVAVVVPCNCTICDMRVRSTHPLITVGYVVVTWGPLVVVLYEAWELGGDHPECVAIDEWGGAIHIEERKGQDDAYGWHVTLPPDVDPQSLVGQYAMGVERVS